MKKQLLAPVLNQVGDPVVRKQMTLAGNEAAAIAWTTPYPLLVLPSLLEEKTAEIQEQTSRQREVRRASAALLEVEAGV